MDFDFAHHAITEAAGGKKAEEAAVLISASKDAYRKGLAEALNLNRTRILAFRNKPQPPPPKPACRFIDSRRQRENLTQRRPAATKCQNKRENRLPKL
ncbi:hypothetical protein DY000_02047437 [Brassica cretica]|uniref:Uncharacterized protein n=1 Tax=Brassica cretica TaxID=69181 RepID=A0ABQ7EWL1_BRACR|nr:hypothetical protein DY000_02047437 [Brassica cretica]